MTDTARTRIARLALTDKVARDLEPPNSGIRVLYDHRLAGFGLRVTAAGTRSFVFNYRVHGRERRITIGQYPVWSALAARRRAEELRRQVDLGNDPLAERNTCRSAPTVRDVFDRYVDEHLPTKAPRSAADDRSMWTNDILPALGSTKSPTSTP